MKKYVIALAIAMAACSATADNQMKAGLWEVRMIKQVVDGQDMAAQMAASQAQMQQMLSRMPPAQRKQMEQSMGGQAMPSGNSQRICISPEMAAQNKPVASGDSRCQPSKYQRSGNKTTFELSCPHVSGTGENVIDGDTIHSKMDMVTTDARGRHTMQSESEMKYLGSDCQGIKPFDQIAKDIQKQRATNK